ncbi:unnamed protein product, partial [Tuber aestivum]
RGNFSWVILAAAVHVPSDKSRAPLAAFQSALRITVFSIEDGGAVGRPRILCMAWFLEESFPFVELEQRDLADLFLRF